MSDRRMDEMLVAALRYAKRGWPVFPCRAKRPLTPHGFRDASTDTGTIADWWRRWPRANIGIPTGAATFVALDVDPRNRGSDTLHELERRHGALPATPCVITGGGGAHYYFAHPGQATVVRCGSVGDGLDLKGDGGYVIAPPSLHPSGKNYVWDAMAHPEDVPLAPLPGWVLGTGFNAENAEGAEGEGATTEVKRHREGEATGQAPALPGSASGKVGQAPALPGSASGKVGQAPALPERIANGSRNATLARLAGTMRARGLGKAEIGALLLAVNRRCDPPLPDAEVLRIAASFARYPAGKLMTPSDNATPDSRSLKQSGNRESGSVPVKCWERPEPEPRRWLLDGLVPEGEPTILYGDGGTMKSYLGLTFAIGVAASKPFLGRPVLSGPVLYVDAELDEAEFMRRAFAVSRGLGLEKPPEGLYYLRLEGSLGDPGTGAAVGGWVAGTGAALVVLDSLTVASFGHDLREQDAVTAIMRQLRYWGTTLCIDHTPAPRPGVPMSEYRPFGSTFKHNLARSALQVLKDRGGMGLVLRPTKANFGPVKPPIYLRVDFGQGSVSFRETGATDSALGEVADELPKVEQVYVALSNHPGGVRPEALAEELGIQPRTVVNYLTTLRRHDRARPLGDGGWQALGLSQLTTP